MVGIVVVSHSHAVARGVAELAAEMGGPDVRIETAGGLDLPGHPIGTDAVLVMEAIERAWSDDGVLVLMDLGSAVLSAEMALDLLPDERRGRILLCEAPFVEGAVAAAVTAKIGAPLTRVAEEARRGLAGKIAHLGGGEAVLATTETAAPEGASRSIRVTVTAPHGLHARPAARLVQTASAFDAHLLVTDRTNGRGPADAASLNGVATLGATMGHEIEVTASGRQAAEALAAIEALAARSFDDHPEPIPEVPPAVEPSGPADTGALLLRGLAASPGVAIGAARRLHAVDLPVPDGRGDPRDEEAALEAAIAGVRVDVERQRETVAARAGPAEAEIFDAHLLLLRDEALLGPTREAIGHGRPAARAWADAVERTAVGWESLEDPYQRARAADIRSVGRQVQARLLGVELPPPRLTEPGILVTGDLSPADAVGLDPATALGIVTGAGGPTSHAAVLARSFGIPAVVGAGDAVLELVEGTPIAVDGSEGIVFVRPSQETLVELERAQRARTAAIAEANAVAREPAMTRDGVRIEVAANIASSADAAVAVAAGADAVGLFRTEFLFIGRSTMPGEAEQEAAYREVAVALDGRPLVIRTLDIGADKPVPYLGQPPEPNPFLGVRGIRLGLERPELLRTQLRAVLRVAHDHPIRLMFPMIATIDELRAALMALASAGDRPATLEVGIMVEVPAAALLADRLAADVDFFSIGTNDLTQYAMAADRGNDRVGSLADALHPAVLRLIDRTVQAADERGRWVGVCGELAGDPGATPILLGLGVRELSVSAPAIGVVKQAVRATGTDEARALATEALDRSSAGDVRALLRDRSGV